MEKIGLINRFLGANSAAWEAYTSVYESEEHQKLQKILENNLHILKEAVKQKDINTLLAIEFLSLTQEMEKHANSPEESNSIKTALLQLEEAQKSLVVVKDPAAYKAVAETYSSKRKEAGLPLDSFREFLKSHTTRLTNRLAGPLSVPEKNLLRQRKENLKAVKEVYAGLQREALGLAPAREAEQGVEL